MFVRESGAGFLLAGLAFVSLVSIALDLTTGLVKPARSYLETFVSPLYLIAESPYLFADQVNEVAASHETLRARNAELERQVLEYAHISQQFAALQAENERMRQLLGSQARLSNDVMISEVVGVIPTASSFELIIDKGADAGLVAGQAVLDAQGLIGQVISVAAFTSRVLVLTDPNHAVPVQINRNGIRSIAGGTGSLGEVVLENVPTSADIQEGDLVETSGLAGRFPAGYPVGRVTSVLVEPTSAYAQVAVEPLAQLDRTRHVLVIFVPSQQAEVAP